MKASTVVTGDADGAVLEEDAALPVQTASNARIKAELGRAPKYPTAQAGVPDALAKITG